MKQVGALPTPLTARRMLQTGFSSVPFSSGSLVRRPSRLTLFMVLSFSFPPGRCLLVKRESPVRPECAPNAVRGRERSDLAREADGAISSGAANEPGGDGKGHQ